MFSKNNIKYILILALGFFWCSSIYLTQEQYLTSFASINFINQAELLYGSLSMALGILLFGLMYKRNMKIKLIYLIFNILSIISMITFFLSKNINVMGLCLCLTCFFGTAGFGAGYHFSLLGEYVDKKYRGRVFSIGYGLASIGTYLLIKLPESFYSTFKSLYLYIPIIIITTYLVLRKTQLVEIKKEENSKSFKNYFIKISIVVLVMSLLSALSTDAMAIYTIDVSGGYGNTRLYYCLGLLISGLLVDKKKNLFEILTIASFIFSLLAIILLKDNYSINIISGLSYLFVGFFVLFRTMVFVNIADNKKNLLWVCAFGLMYSRIIEGLMVLFEDSLLSNFTLLIIVISVVLSIVIVLYFLLYFQNNKVDENEAIKIISLKYNLGNQEEKVLNLLIHDYSNQEMADELVVSINTIRNHVANIYKKTGMKKKELKEKCLYFTH